MHSNLVRMLLKYLALFSERYSANMLANLARTLEPLKSTTTMMTLHYSILCRWNKQYFIDASNMWLALLEFLTTFYGYGWLIFVLVDDDIHLAPMWGR